MTPTAPVFNQPSLFQFNRTNSNPTGSVSDYNNATYLHASAAAGYTMVPAPASPTGYTYKRTHGCLYMPLIAPRMSPLPFWTGCIYAATN